MEGRGDLALDGKTALLKGRHIGTRRGSLVSDSLAETLILVSRCGSLFGKVCVLCLLVFSF